ncbi:MAG: amino acid adenylation domain-containing protein [Alphaproteobacteria bacterium]|nr:amino acid adenylation domain-containing protein [Alphaproteobacteria bacterium]
MLNANKKNVDRTKETLDTKNIYPLTSQQKGLWFEYKLDPNNNCYNCYFHHEIKGNLDEKHFIQSLYALMEIFEPFRTSFIEKNNEIYQVIQDVPNEAILLKKDLTILQITEESRIELAKKLLMEECAKPYDLNQSFPARIIFIKVSPTLFYFALAFHHIVFDAVSGRIYYQFLANFYNNTLNPSFLYKGAKEYREIFNKEELYSEKEKKKSIEYWENELKERELKIPFPRFHSSSYDIIAIEKLPFSFNERVSTHIKSFSQKNKITPFIFLSACFASLIYRYWSCPSFVIGYPVNIRPRSFQNSPGFYASLLPWRFSFEKNLSFKGLIAQMSQQRQSDKEYQNIVFPDLVSYLRTKETHRDLKYNTLISSTILFTDFLLTGLEVTCLHVTVGGPPTDLFLATDFTTSDFKSLLQYDPSLFSEKFIKRFCSHFKNLVSLVLKNPNKKINEIEFLRAEEKHQILIDWNNTYIEYPAGRTIHQQFEEQVEKTPDNVAVIFEDEQLTYKELNEKANQLAHYLRERGVKPDTLVAIVCERSFEMIIGILGILKAGGVYVPIDPAYPQERIQFMLEDTQAPLLLTQQDVFEKLPRTEAEVFLLDKDNQKLTPYPTANLSHITLPHHLAYVIYTSGSTGKPKGVMIEHQSICNRLLWWQDYTPLSSDDRYLHQFSFSFDGAVVSLWWPLLNGVLVLLPSKEGLNDGHYLSSLILKHQVTTLLATPSLIEALDLPRSSVIRKIMLAGESFTKKTFERLSPTEYVKIYNFYGPTESSIIATSYEATGKDITTVTVPIGQPVANTQVYILDMCLKPVPIGVSGELYIGGEGLARGYLNRPELTAERFIKNPFQTEEEKTQEKNIRLYKTGDLCRWLEDGNIEYIGRTDFQVKIRGFRIELGEIEASLLKHPQVKETIVIAREDSPGDKKLVAYLVFKERVKDESRNKDDVHAIRMEEIRSYLQFTLPGHMIPPAFVVLEAMPLTSHGKVDRKALPAPEFTSNELYVAPRSELEMSVCKIWEEVLSLPEGKVGIRDDFFKLGGDSIISIQLVSKIRQKLGLNLSVKDIFSYKTIERLCGNILSQNLRDKLQIKAEHGLLTGEVDLLPIQEWFFDNNFCKASHWNQSFLIKTPELDNHRLETCLKQLVYYHDSFRLNYKKNKNDQYIQYYDDKMHIKKLQTLDIRSLGVKENSKEFKAKLEKILTSWQSSFNLVSGPLYSMGYIYGYKDGSSRIYFALHHLIVDAVSWRILVEDLKTLYEGKQLELKRSSYRQWVNTVREYSSQHQEEKNYWHNMLIDYDPNKQFEELRINENIHSDAILELSEEQTQKLLKESYRAYNTQINDLLLTALSYALAEVTGTKVNYIILEGHGREEIDKEIDITRTLGWFTTMYPVRLEVQEEIERSIKYIKENLRQIPNKGIGYGALFGYRLSTLPRIIFNYLGQFDGAQKQGNFWSIIDASSGISVNTENQDNNILNINSFIIDGKLKFFIATKLDSTTTYKFTNIFQKKLEEIIEHCASKGFVERSISDFDNFEPYLAFNTHLDTKNHLFIFPPGEGGAESYLNNIVPQIKNKKLILFNNYYLHHHSKLGEYNSAYLTYEKLAYNYILYMKLLQPRGPYNLFGWSFGGCLAFEVARQLIHSGDKVANLILVDSFFNYKKVALKLGIQPPEFDINFKYNPILTNQVWEANTILFKASEIISTRNLEKFIMYGNKFEKTFKYYVQKTLYNHLDDFLPTNCFKVIQMDSDHLSWAKDYNQITKVCNAIASL